MLRRVGTVIAFVSDLAAAKAFYRDILGLKVRVDSPGWVEFETEGATFALHPGVPPRPPGPIAEGPSLSVGFDVESVKKAYATLVAKGVAFERSPTPIAPGVWVANFRDRDGNELAISGPA